MQRLYTYLFSSKLGELFSIFICLLIFGSFPLAAAPLLLINLISDTFPIMSILSDGIFEHKPLHIFAKDDKALFTTRSKTVICVQTVIIAAVSIIAYSIGNAQSNTFAQTMMFAVLILSQLFNMASTKFEDFFYRFAHFRNRVVSIVLALSTVLVVLLLLTPMGTALGLSVLSFGQFMTAVILSLIVFISGLICRMTA